MTRLGLLLKLLFKLPSQIWPGHGRLERPRNAPTGQPNFDLRTIHHSALGCRILTALVARLLEKWPARRPWRFPSSIPGLGFGHPNVPFDVEL